MGFTTKGKETTTRFYGIRSDVDSNVQDICDDTGWDYSDVVNRAVMYYMNKYKKNQLSDTAPMRKTEGFTTAGQEEVDKTLTLTNSVISKINEKSENWQWYKKDVVNRALMYYINDIKSGEIDDPRYNSMVQ